MVTGADGGIRTRTGFPPRDFKSLSVQLKRQQEGTFAVAQPLNQFHCFRVIDYLATEENIASS